MGILRLDEVNSLSLSVDSFSRCACSVMLAQELNAYLVLGDSVDDHVVEGVVCGRDCDIVWVCDRA